MPGKLLDQCENQELQAPGGIAIPPVYGQLLALHLLHNDMNNARYLWKRIPPATKSAISELGGIWSVAQRIWQRDFPGIYTTINAHQWSETVQPTAVKGILEQGWQVDSPTRMAMPKTPVAGALDVSFNSFIPLSEPAPVPLIPSEQQLARLTDYVAFLENWCILLSPRSTFRILYTDRYRNVRFLFSIYWMDEAPQHSLLSM
uniref:CSN8/PSMD8/EIF3K domain-containing protein n=1 Tax=Canis lupus familiaris TaxID=9615 RepID=A0A8C0N6J5_CANLF